MDTQDHHLASFATTLVAIFTLTTPAFAGGVGAGTLIENTASATYTDGEGVQTVASNTVTVRVDELIDVTVTSLDSGVIGAAPGEAVLTFEVTNTGNGPEAYLLTANPAISGNDFDTVVAAVAFDTNGNGTYDEGVDEILTEPETTQLLDRGEALTVFVITKIPNEVLDGASSEVELLAEAVTGTGESGTVFAGAGVDGGDAIVGSTGARASATGSFLVGVTTVDLQKSVTIVDPFGGSSAVPGSTATFTITATVSGSGEVDDLIVTDAIPSGTTYSAGTLALDTAALSDASDEDAGEASNDSGILVNLGTIAGGTVHTITFDVTIE